MTGVADPVSSGLAGSFIFARGNASKLLALPAYGLGRIASMAVARRPDRIVVGSAFGVADGALALVRELQQHRPELLVTWLAGTPDEAQEARTLGVAVAIRSTRAGLAATLRAGTVVITHGFGDVSRYGVDGARVVQLWHGTPLKRLHLDSPAALRLPVLDRFAVGRRLIASMYQRASVRISLFPVSSEEAQRRVGSAFHLSPEQVQVLGEPRTDVLFAGTPADRSRAARALLEAAVGPLGQDRVILHAPTWRDGQADPGQPSAADWALVTRWLDATGTTVVVRPHPLGVGDWAWEHPRVRLLTSRAVPALNEVLWAADALVTDYSSVLVDYAVTGRPIVHLAADAAAYAQSRGLYEPFEAFAGGPPETTWAGVIPRLDAVLEPGPSRELATRHSRALAERYHAHVDGRSAQRVADAAFGPSAEAGAPGPASSPTVFFESDYGRNASCNPRAIDAELARRRPDVRRVWSVATADVAVPAGAEAVVQGTEAWRTARDAAALLVVNDWIRDGWRPRRGQAVLQTWHGTPLKRIALGRRGRTPREVAAVLRQSTRWTAMLAQSQRAAAVLRRAYAVRRTPWMLGYPRNDALLTADPEPVREALGIAGRRVAFYAPTWRDDDLSAEHLLDVPDLADRLGPGWVVLVRGHARTMEERPPTTGAGVVDVTRWPDVTDLLLVTDVLVTDYSSVMFDFSVTGRPMVFHVPDLEGYRRGTYWNLGDRAPGPLVRTTAECAEAVLGAEADAPRWAERYARWRAQFNPLDDGGASRRVVDRLLAEGLLPA